MEGLNLVTKGWKSGGDINMATKGFLIGGMFAWIKLVWYEIFRFPSRIVRVCRKVSYVMSRRQ